MSGGRCSHPLQVCRDDAVVGGQSTALSEQALAKCAPLVADFRVDRRARRFPRPSTGFRLTFWPNMAALAATAIKRDLWQALTSPLAELAAFQERAALRLAIHFR